MQTWNEGTPPIITLPDMAGRTAIVTGASRGIGRAVVQALQANGVFCYGFADIFDSVESGPLWQPIVCDLREPEAIRGAVDSVGRESLDYLVNVAGIDPKVPLSEGDETTWHRIIDLNLRAYYLMIRACEPLLVRGAGKSIVNISSINYRLGISGRSIYTTSKAGILGLTVGLARELGKQDIRINTVTPGWIFTERQIEEYFATEDADVHLNTLAEKQSLRLKIHPLDVANHVLFYLSSVSRASTGHNMVVDGGWLLE
ncbi:MAG: SDR family oxidoreductase [Chloroflexota bacterium]